MNIKYRHSIANHRFIQVKSAKIVNTQYSGLTACPYFKNNLQTRKQFQQNFFSQWLVKHYYIVRYFKRMEKLIK